MSRAVILFPEFLGDFLMLTPAIHHLKSQYPSLSIDIYTTEFLGQLAIYHPAIDNVYVIPDCRSNGKPDTAKLKAFGQSLKKTGYRIGYFVEDYLFWALWYGNVKVKIHEKSNPLFKLFCTGIGGADRRDNLRHMAQRHMGNMAALTKNAPSVDDYDFSLNIPEDKCHFDDQPKGDYVYLSVDGKSAKRFNKAFYHTLINDILDRGHTVVLAGQVDHFECDAVFKERPGVVYAVGKTTLYQMFGLIRGASWVISNDSGPSHVACMEKKPSVIFFPAKGNRPNLTCGFYKDNRSYKKSPSLSRCELICHSYSQCPEYTCEVDYDWEHVKIHLDALFESPNRNWIEKHNETLKASLNIMLLSDNGINAEVSDALKEYQDEQVSILHVDVPRIESLSFAQMLSYIQRHNLTVVHVLKKSLPLKFRWWNWWLRISERAYVEFVADIALDDAIDKQLKKYEKALTV